MKMFERWVVERGGSDELKSRNGALAHVVFTREQLSTFADQLQKLLASSPATSKDFTLSFEFMDFYHLFEEKKGIEDELPVLPE